MSEIKDYTKEIEDLFIQFMLTDPELFVRCKGIISEEYFTDPKNIKAIRFIVDHSNKYTALPTVDQIKAMTGKQVERIEDIHDEHRDWFLEEFENFCRHKAMEIQILSSPALLKEGRYGEVEAGIKAAVQIGLVRDLGTDYYADPQTRLDLIKQNRGMLSTGWRDVDKKLYGGFNRGEITIFAGQSGAGKSLFLQNLALNWAEMGLNVVYITLELSENLTAMRLDAMTTGYETREILKNSEDVSMKVRQQQQSHHGHLRLKQLKNGCTANDIRAYIKEYEIQSGTKVDACLVDYLDLCMPASAKVNFNDTFIKDKFVSEELRNLAVELNILMASASQLNRGSYEELAFDPSHIAGGISKVNTADNVIGIFTTAQMKESGRYQLQFMKTRSSSGVGSKCDLAFNIRSLRIFDVPEDELDSEPVEAVKSATEKTLAAIKNKNVANKAKDSIDGDEVLKGGAAMKDFLKKIKD